MNMAFHDWSHAKEMTHGSRTIDINQDCEDPYIFARSPRLKSVDPGQTFYMPKGCEKLDWENELIAVMGTTARSLLRIVYIGAATPS